MINTGFDLATGSFGITIGKNEFIQKTPTNIRYKKRSIRRLNRRNTEFQKPISFKSFINLIISFLNVHVKILALVSIVSILFLLAIIIPEYWQLFLNLGIGGLISILTLENKKS